MYVRGKSIIIALALLISGSAYAQETVNRLQRDYNQNFKPKFVQDPAGNAAEANRRLNDIESAIPGAGNSRVQDGLKSWLNNERADVASRISAASTRAPIAPAPVANLGAAFRTAVANFKAAKASNATVKDLTPLYNNVNAAFSALTDPSDITTATPIMADITKSFTLAKAESVFIYIFDALAPDQKDPSNAGKGDRYLSATLIRLINGNNNAKSPEEEQLHDLYKNFIANGANNAARDLAIKELNNYYRGADTYAKVPGSKWQDRARTDFEKAMQYFNAF